MQLYPNTFKNWLNSDHKPVFSFFRIIKIVDTVGLKLIVKQQPETLLSSSLALSVTPTDGTNFQEILFSISDPNNVQVLAPVLSPVFLFLLLITTASRQVN